MNPTPEQVEYLKRACGTRRFIYNWGREQWEKQYQAYKTEQETVPQEQRVLTPPNAFVLKKQFNETTAKQFGSGWGWLVWKGGKLGVITTPNQDSPLSQGLYPILGNDVWEHAYYLNYQNRRPDYLKAWWNVVNWDAVAKNY